MSEKHRMENTQQDMRRLGTPIKIGAMGIRNEQERGERYEEREITYIPIDTVFTK